MKPSVRRPSLEDVLDAFAAEQDSAGSTLVRYLQDYPEYTEELVDLSHERSRFIVEDNAAMSAADTALIGLAWKRHTEAAPQATVDPFAALTVSDLRRISALLDVPRQVVTAFRERRIIAHSVPGPFLTRFAAAVHVSVEQFVSALSLPSTHDLARSHKADVRPGVDVPVTFERVLRDAGVSDEKRELLLMDDV